MMAGADKSIKLFIRDSEYGEVKRVESKSLYEFCEWLERAKQRKAKVLQNGMVGVIVITANRYFDCHIGD
jgi:hypothetical protein